MDTVTEAARLLRMPSGGTSKLNLWTTARTTRSGDAVSEILAFEDGRVRARILTRSQILTVWLPMDAVTVDRHFTWGPA